MKNETPERSRQLIRAETVRDRLRVPGADLTRAEEIRLEIVETAVERLIDELNREEESDEQVNDGRVNWSDCQ